MFNAYLKPMEPKYCSHAFDSDQHVFQVKWDGVRILAFVNKTQVRLQNRKLKNRTIQYPEMQQLSKQIAARDAIMDGEMISLKEGKPSFSRILQRDLVSAVAGQRTKLIQVPIIFMVFDILYLNGLDLTPLSWEERDYKLKETLIPSKEIQIVESFPRGGRALYQAVLAEKLEGIVAKNISSPYVIGGKMGFWQKIKPRKDINCVLGGYVQEKSRIKSLLIGAYQEGKLKYLGKAGSGLSEKTSGELITVLPGLEISHSPFDPEPKKEKNWHWVKPILTIKIEYMEYTQDMQLRQPTIKGFTKINPKECILVEE